MKTYSFILATLLLLIAMTGSAKTQSGYQVKKLSEQAYLFTYSWGAKTNTNIGVVASDEGFLLINTMMIGQVDQLEAELAKIADKPVKYVINSNSDWYNTSANEYFANKGATIIAHHGAIYQTNNYSQLLFTDNLSMTFGNEQITAYKSGAHSAGHINIHLANANAIFVADSYSPRWPSPLGPEGIDGLIAGLHNIIELADDNTTIVPGNVAMSITASKADVEREVNLRSQLYSQFAKLQRQGQTASAAVKDKTVISLMKHYEEYAQYHDKPWLFDSTNFHRLFTKRTQSKHMTQDYIGHYQLPDGRIIEVFAKGERLYAKAKGIFYFNLLPVAQDTFRFEPEHEDLHLQFVRNQQHKISGIKAHFTADSDHYLSRLGEMSITKIN